MKKLLIICTGNTCRSPMAGVLARAWFEKNGIEGAEVKTAGLFAQPQAPAAQQGITVMEEKGLDLKQHQAQQITAELVDWADLILTMTLNHKLQLVATYPQAMGKTFTLGDYSQPSPLGEELNRLYEKIYIKEQQFLLTHQQELDELYTREAELKSELLKIEAEVEEWKKRLEGETRTEREGLYQLEDEITKLDVQDPFGGTVELYRKTAIELEELLANALKGFSQKGSE